MGPEVHVVIERAGFYPAGGGRASIHVNPVRALTSFDLVERGPVTRTLARAIVAGLPGLIGRLELGKLGQLLGLSSDQLQMRQLSPERGPGNVLAVEIESEHVAEVVTGFNMRGVSAEAVAETVLRDARQYVADGFPVGPYLAHQLPLPLAMAGEGSFTPSAPRRHTTTNCDIIERFLPVKITKTPHRRGDWMVSLHVG